MKVKFGNQETLSQANGGVQADSTVNRVILRSCLDLLPKLKLGIFDGNSIHWSDWISMFQSIIDDVIFHFSFLSCTNEEDGEQNAFMVNFSDDNDLRLGFKESKLQLYPINGNEFTSMLL